MLIFWSSHSQHSCWRGTSIADCPVCNRPQPFRYSEIYQSDKLYSVEVAETLVAKVLECEVCGYSERFRRKVVIPADRDWRVKDDLQVLADRLGADMEIPDEGLITDNTLRARFDQLRRVRVSWEQGVRARCLAFALLAAILIFVAHEKVFMDLGNSIFTFVVAMTVFFIVFGSLDLKRANRLARFEKLDEFLHRFDLWVSDLEDYVEKLPSLDYKYRDFVEDYAGFKQEKR